MFQFIKKTKWHFEYTGSPSLNIIIQEDVGGFNPLFYFFHVSYFQKLVIGNFLFPLGFKGINSELFLSKRSSYLEILWKLDVLGNKTKSVEFEEKQNRAKTQ